MSSPDGINKFLDTTSLEDSDKASIKYILEYLEGKHPTELSSKTYLLCGEPGVGKTFLVEKLLESIAKATEGMSFREIENLWNRAMYQYVENGRMTSEIMNRVILDSKNRVRERDSMFG